MNIETVEPTKHAVGRQGRGKTFLNWALALFTIPVAALVYIVAIGAVMGMAGCTTTPCEAPGPSLFGVLLYGAPVVAVLAIVASFFTASRRWGTAVPACALGLQAIDLITIVATF